MIGGTSPAHQRHDLSTYWTLDQATAWIMFRDEATVALFQPPKPEQWGVFIAYVKRLFPDSANHKGTSLVTAITEGRLIATSCRLLDEHWEAIAPIAWIDLV